MYSARLLKFPACGHRRGEISLKRYRDGTGLNIYKVYLFIILYFHINLSNRCYNISNKGMQFQPCNLYNIMLHHVMHACWWCNWSHWNAYTPVNFQWVSLGKLKFDQIVAPLKNKLLVHGYRVQLSSNLCTWEVAKHSRTLTCTRQHDSYTSLVLGNLSCTSITQW